MLEQIRGLDIWTDGCMTGDKVMRLPGYKLKNSSPYHPITLSPNRCMDGKRKGCMESYTSIHQNIYTSQQHRKTAFTLAEGATHVATCNSNRKAAFTKPSRATNEVRDEHASTETLSFRCKCERWRLMRGAVDSCMPKAAFTLAEVLVTLGIIGVVAAITMPVLITNINERSNSERHANIAYKITQAMEQMRAHGKLVQYASTSDFVDELQKFLKITKRCDAAHIKDCWPTETVLDATGNEYYIEDCRKRKNLLPGSSTNGENVGLILADGASVILTYDPNANPIDIGDKISVDNKHPLPIGNGKSKDFAYTTSVTGAIDFITDVNGKKGPNSETRDGKYYDIRSFKLAKLSNACTAERGSQGCVKLAGTASTWAPVNCTSSNSESEDYQKYCGPTPSRASNDYWAGAKKLCAEAGMTLPDEDTLYNIYTAWKNNGQYSTELASAGSFRFQSSTENSEHAPYYYIQSVGFYYGNRPLISKSDNGGNHAVLCVQ